ncbi:MAG: acyl-ACP--UDP-N-acetylglucosamine O-acyltransferase [Gammaproteobacteria bacterium]|jgi:UDP-N-acetylglucosamine acyltransferase|nr:acyl-ACP--UDP-N-acetylglucosamine O-acyltransferase [Gammaproteobacteria bacterium]
MGQIHPSAVVEPGAELHPSVQVGPHSWIGAGARLGEGCVVHSAARITGAVRMGPGNTVHHGAVIGDLPQDLSFDPSTATYVEVGAGNTFREAVTIHRATRAGQATRIGDRNFLMAYSHVAHDCVVGDQNVFANAAMLAGHVHVDHHAFLSGHTAIHQFARIGAYVMVSGLTGVSQDVPPFVTVDGHRADIVGLNVVGLRRAGFDQAARRRIKAAYQLLYRAGLSREAALARLRAEPQTPEIVEILRFFDAGGRRGVTGWRRIAAGGAEEGD